MRRILSDKEHKKLIDKEDKMMGATLLKISEIVGDKDAYFCQYESLGNSEIKYRSVKFNRSLINPDGIEISVSCEPDIAIQIARLLKDNKIIY